MRPEILAPVGSMEALNAALAAGCDAVYFGLPSFGARAFANNFNLETTKEVIERCHLCGVKVYITMNTILYEDEIEDAYQMAKKVHSFGVDALIIQDLGFIHLLHHRLPNLVLHASTQLSISNPHQIEQLKKLGVQRVVLARECTREEIQACVNTGIEVEVFVHGALCICYSGQCYFSSVHYGRSGNRGMCAQPCRMKYSLYEDGNKLETDGEYLLSPKDLSLMDEVNTLADMGVCSLKIEGRMKTALYVATVARTYRKAIDDYLEDPKKYEANMPWYKDQISNCTYRQFTTGFYFGKPSEESQIYDSNTYIREYTYLGIIGEIKDGLYRIEQRNKFSVGEVIEIMKPDGQNVEATVEKIIDEDGNEQESAPHPKQVLYVALSADASVYDILRRAEKETE